MKISSECKSTPISRNVRWSVSQLVTKWKIRPSNAQRGPVRTGMDPQGPVRNTNDQ